MSCLRSVVGMTAVPLAYSRTEGILKHSGAVWDHQTDDVGHASDQRLQDLCEIGPVGGPPTGCE
jgi:hypothetical protein